MSSNGFAARAQAAATRNENPTAGNKGSSGYISGGGGANAVGDGGGRVGSK
jgi:hypothetical protein